MNRFMMITFTLFALVSKVQGEVDMTKTITVQMKTSQGDIEMVLYPERAPETVENFLSYAKDGHYNGTIFHRVIDNFMIQGGGFTKDMTQKETRTPVRNEADNGLKNEVGTIAMARTGVVDSATSQFFINVSDNDFLDHREKSTQGYGYCVFGKVSKGMDVVEKIKKVKTTRKPPYDDVPAETIEIQQVTIVE